MAVGYRGCQQAQNMKYFSSSKQVEFRIVEGGYHYLSMTNSKEISEQTLQFVGLKGDPEFPLCGSESICKTSLAGLSQELPLHPLTPMFSAQHQVFHPISPAF